MSKPRKDRSTPTGSSPVDATGVSAADKTTADKTTANKTAAKTATEKTAAKKTTDTKKSTAATARDAAAEDLARRTTAQKVRVTGGENPTWWVPTMVTFMLVGLFWLVVTYLSQGEFPAPGLGVLYNLGIGFGLVMAGFLMTTRWK